MRFKAIITAESKNTVKYEKDGKPGSFNVGSLRLERINEGTAPRYLHGEMAVSGDDPGASVAEGLVLGATVEVTITTVP